MNCNKCGMPLEEGLQFCENCGAPVELPAEAAQTPVADVHNEDTVPTKDVPVEEVPAEETPVEEAPADEVSVEEVSDEEVSDEEAPALELNMTAETPKKKSLLKPVLIGVGVVLLALAVVVALNFSSITNWFLMNFGSAEDIFRQVETQTIDRSTDALAEAYGLALSESQAKQGRVTGDIHIKLGDTLVSSLTSTMNAYGAPIDASFLADILLRMDVDYRAEGYRVTMGLGLGDHVVLSMDMLQDMTNGNQYLALPELSDYYIFLPSEYFASGVDQAAALAVYPKAEVLNSLLDRYLMIPLEYLSSVAKDDGTVVIEDMERDAVILTADINETDAANMRLRILRTAREDQELKSIIDAYTAYCNDVLARQYGDAYEAVDHYADFLEELDAEIARIEEELPELGTDVALTWVIAMDAADGTVIEQSVSTPEDGVLVKLAVLRENNDVEVYVVLQDTAILVKGTMKDDAFTGNLTATVNDVLAMKLDVTDFSEDSGTVKIQFGRAFAEAMGADSSITALTVTITANDAQSGTVQFLMGGMELFTMTIDYQDAESQPITFPEKALDPNSQLDIYTWVMDMDFNALLDNMKNAGVPDYVVQAAKQVLFQMFGFSVQ